MSSEAIREAVEALKAAVETVEGVRVYTDPGATVDPPGVVIGPPTLIQPTYGLGYSDAAFRVVIIVKQDDRALEILWDLVPEITEVIERNTDAVVMRASPGQWGEQASNTLPCYELQTEMPL